MRQFVYEYIDDHGQNKFAIINAETFDEATSTLNNQKIAVISLEEGTPKNLLSTNAAFRIRGKVSRRELIEFCIYLGTLSEAGLSLTIALTEFTEESQNEFFNHVVTVLRSQVENGSTLSFAMSLFPRIFTREFIFLIKAGESTGTIPNSFKELRMYLEWLERLNGEIKQATTYPLFISVALGGFVLFLFSSVVPKITSILIDMKIELPLITKVIIALSDGARTTWPFVLATGFGIPLLYTFMANKSEPFARMVDKVKLQIPIFGNLIRLIIQARFTKNFSVLHSAGIPIVENIELSKGFIGNRLYAECLDNAGKQVQEGLPLSGALKASGLFGGLVIKMFAIGESAGNLDETLRHAAAYYDEEVPRRIKQVFSIMEPLIIVVLIGIIGMVAMAIFLPIISISKGLG